MANSIFSINASTQTISAHGVDIREFVFKIINDRFNALNHKYTKAGASNRNNNNNEVIPTYASCQGTFNGNLHISEMSWTELVCHMAYELSYSLTDTTVAELNDLYWTGNQPSVETNIQTISNLLSI